METLQELRFRGSIKDAQTGVPLSGVKVSTDRDYKGKVSTKKGSFTIKVELLDNASLLQFRYPGYKPLTKSVSSTSPREMDIAMVKDSNKKVVDDYTLIQQALAGKQMAYKELMGRYKESVYFVVLKMVNNNPDDAEDLTLEAFGKAFNKLDKFSPDFAFSTWLFRIAINNTIDFIRKKRLDTLSIDQPINGHEGEQLTPSIESEAPDPEEKFIKDQRITLIHQITDKLSPKYRQLIQLRYFEEYSYAEISEEMNLPIGTVKAQLFRAKQLLQNILADKKDDL